MDLKKELITYGNKQMFDQLEKIVQKTSINKLMELLTSEIKSSDTITLLNYILLSYPNNVTSNNKIFIIVMAVLKQLNKEELNTKQTFDYVSRIFNELPKFGANHLIELIKFCIDCIKIGDSKCLGWKDLLPELLNVISVMPNIQVDGEQISSSEFRQKCIKNITDIKWSITILTSLASMFKVIRLTKDDRTTILCNLCERMEEMSPLELPPLAYQIFLICDSPILLILPILSFDKYFYKHYYHKIFQEIESEVTDYDSIDTYSTKELREAEETILYHLNKYAEINILEKDMVNSLRVLASAPKLLLTPFTIGAILALCKFHHSDLTQISTSVILTFLRNVIKNNELEKEICRKSAWAGDVFNTRKLNLNTIFSIIIDQSKGGQDVITQQLLGLAFVLLKTHNSTLNSIGVTILDKFISKRFIFGNGIIKILSRFLIADQESLQYSECLTRLSYSSPLLVNECGDTIENILKFFLLIPGEHVMRIMPSILPFVKISFTIRDCFIDVLQKGLYERELSTKKMAVYGFCLLLKELRNNNSQRSFRHGRRPGVGGIADGSQLCQTISGGFSFLSQATFATANNPQRHFDLLTLEILGILWKCFHQPQEIKVILYQGLTKATLSNPKLTPHILQFFEWHFTSYFEFDDLSMKINFDGIVREQNETVVLYDHLGKLIQFIGNCLNLCEQHKLSYDSTEVKKLFDNLMLRIDTVTIDQLGIVGTYDQKMNHIGNQYLNILEAIIGYAICTAVKENTNTIHIIRLFKHHIECTELLKTASVAKKAKKTTKANASADNSSMLSSRLVVFKPENIWDLNTIERLLRVIFDDDVSFLTSNQTSQIRSNRDFGRYILRVTCLHIESLRSQSLNYLQLKHCRTTFIHLCKISRIIFEKCVKNLINLYTNFDHVSAQISVECFRQCLQTITELYYDKFNAFIQAINVGDQGIMLIITSIHTLIETFVLQNPDDNDSAEDELGKIPNCLVQCLEILYNRVDQDDKNVMNIYNWLYGICQNNVIKRDMNLIHKLLFNQRMKTQTGVFFNSIAMQIEKILGQIETDNEEEICPEFELKSINLQTIETCVLQLCNVFRQQIDEIEFFITKLKSLQAKIKIFGGICSNNYTQSMKTNERKICSQLIHMTNSIIHLVNTCIPLGQCMDALIRLINQFYICLSNLTKHFIVRYGTIGVSFQSIKFEQLVHVTGKPLAKKIYTLIPHIEDNILQDNRRKKIDPQSDRAKVMRDTKFLPKLILRIENYNRFIILLGKKTKTDLNRYLHIGTVRDFRIKTTVLRDALNDTIQHSSQMVIDETRLDEPEFNDEDSNVVVNDDNDIMDIGGDTDPNNLSGISSIITETTDYTMDEHDDVAPDKRKLNNDILLKNVAQISQRAKRKLQDKTNTDNLLRPPPAPPRLRKRTSIKINKDSLKKK